LSGSANRAAPELAPDRQSEATIEALTVALDRLRRGAAALKTENQQLRAEVVRLESTAARGHDGLSATADLGMVAQVALPVSSRTPGAARLVIVHCLTGLVSQEVLRDAVLLVSELVTNGLLHGEFGDGDSILVRVYIAAETVRLEIDNPGSAGVVAGRHPDRQSDGGGFGLNLVDDLAVRWGVRRSHGTSVWFETGRA
jgi:anti-sigma regulatory factor (Ser/Thr protein kinase)